MSIVAFPLHVGKCLVQVKVDIERAWQALGRDKKAEGGRTKLVLLEKLGKPAWGVELPDDEVRAALEELVER